MFARRVLMRRPEAGLGEAVVSLIDREPIALDRAGRQWDSVSAVLSSAGWHVVVVEGRPGDPPCPDGVFVGDAVVWVAGRVVLARSALESRRAERQALRRTLASLHVGVTPIRRPATLDGGDVVRVGDTLYVGVGSRTNKAGVAHLTRIVAGSGLTVVPVPLHKSVQLNSGIAALPCGTVLGYPPLVDDPSVFDVFVPVPEPAGAHVFPLGDGRVLMGADAPGSVRTLATLGYETVVVDISEFEKREGTMTCLVAPF